MKKNLFIISLLLIAFNTGFAQTHKYNIISNGTKAGELQATRTVSGNVTIINVLSNFSVHLFIQVNVKYEMNCKYIDGELVEYSVETFKNGELHSSSKGTKEGGLYKTIEDGAESTHKEDVRYSGAMLYFKEPKGLKTVFSEIHSVDKIVQEIGKDHFQVSEPQTGQSNQYFDQNGILQKALISHPLFSFIMVLEQ